MNIFKSQPSPADNPESSLRLPAQKRISIPSSTRLQTITEGENAAGASTPPIPRRSSQRLKATPSHSVSPRRPATPNRNRWSGSATSWDTQRTAPPAYDWVPEPIEGHGNEPVEGEKLAALRSGGAWKTPARGGWKRLALIAALVLVVIIALAVGLGVGLTRRKHEHSHQSPATTPDSTPPQKFPLGQYSMVTVLSSMSTDCTANYATWRCYPYTVYNPTVGSTSNTSMSFFNWIIANTSDTYATASNTPSTPDGGIPANLTVSTTDNPFYPTFSNKALTYIASSTNTTSPHYTFDFTMPKTVIPSPAITMDNSQAECFFNQTVFSGTIYLTAPRTFPTGDLVNSTAIGGYQQWPYAVEISQTAAGGTDVPNCYETVDGQVGQPITTGVAPLGTSTQCSCDYRNY